MTRSSEFKCRKATTLVMLRGFAPRIILSASSCVRWEKSWVDQSRSGDYIDCIKGGNPQLEDGYDGQSLLAKFPSAG